MISRERIRQLRTWAELVAFSPDDATVRRILPFVSKALDVIETVAVFSDSLERHLIERHFRKWEPPYHDPEIKICTDLNMREGTFKIEVIDDEIDTR